MRKRNGKEGKQTLAELNSAHCRSQAKFPLVQTSYIKRIKLLLLAPYNKYIFKQA